MTKESIVAWEIYHNGERLGLVMAAYSSDAINRALETWPERVDPLQIDGGFHESVYCGPLLTDDLHCEDCDQVADCYLQGRCEQSGKELPSIARQSMLAAFVECKAEQRERIFQRAVKLADRANARVARWTALRRK